MCSHPSLSMMAAVADGFPAYPIITRGDRNQISPSRLLPTVWPVAGSTTCDAKTTKRTDLFSVDAFHSPQCAVVVSWKKGTMGTLASQAEIGVWDKAPGPLPPPESGRITPRQKSTFYMQIPAIVHFFCGWKMVRSAVHNAFASTLAVGTAFRAFRQLFNHGNGVPTRLPRNDHAATSAATFWSAVLYKMCTFKWRCEVEK